MRILKTMMAIAITCLSLFVSSGIASAVAAKFFSTSSSVTSSGALMVSWDERGLGNGDINYTLTADATALYACINGGGKHPQAANKEAFSDSVSAAGTFESKNGRVQAYLVAGPVAAPSFTCPGGQRRVLASVTYTSIVLTDTTNGSSVNVADASKVFWAV